ncbi:MAG: hypothetical protein IKZ94_02640 [Lachnospiraceae bacterium]|nr:hypothetical protein [Lachnospiraceae bacterium]
MFIKLHGVKGARLLFNVDHIRAFQEITEDSKYAVNKESGAKSLIQVDDKLIPVRESIVEIQNIIKKAELFGGA